jgi:rhodanese-related sulfurtransferase
MGSSAPPLRPEQFERHRRHLSLPEFGFEGQRKLLEGSVLLIGAREVEARLDELEAGRERPVVVHCHRDGRSVEAARILLGAGFTDVAALSGGIEAWSLSVDPEVPRY